MSNAATARAWASGASGNDLLVYLALADVAGNLDDPYDYAYPAVATIAKMTRVSPRTVQRCLRSLEADGHIRKTGEHAWGRGKITVQYRIEDVTVTGRQSDGGDTGGADGASPVTPNPSSNPSREERETRASADDEKSDPRMSAPADFPEELRPHARHVLQVLRSVAEQHGAREVYPLAVGRVIMAYPRRPLVETAHALATWAVDPPRPIKDVVSSYRTFLQRERDLAATERLADDGSPTSGRAPDPSGVTPLFGGGAGRKLSNAEQVEQNIRAMRAHGAGHVSQ